MEATEQPPPLPAEPTAAQVCEENGNCSLGCPQGKCALVCQRGSNCDFACDGGKCDVTCQSGSTTSLRPA